MSVQFGRWSFDRVPATPEYLAKVREILSPYGPDGGTSYSRGGVDLLYYAFHATKESRRETQPHVSASGAIVTWDGRLDNRAELLHRLSSSLSLDSTDVAIVSAAYEQWGTDCFAKLLGDWAVSIWNPNERLLVLAKDAVGTRHLYYSPEDHGVTWSNVLDPLVLFAGKTLALCEEYIAGWFSLFPAAHLTPYNGIHGVPPSSFVRVSPTSRTGVKYWDFDPAKKVRYSTDGEYEEHFRTVFRESVRRRLRSDLPVLAELSGGMDSSSIVCMADRIIGDGIVETPRLDTVSYYDDSEPNWNERPFFTMVEESRGRKGCHIDVANVRCHQSVEFGRKSNHFWATPGPRERRNEAARQFAAYVASHGNRVLLSGVGGDEVTGGVPTPIPELEDLLARCRFRALAHQLRVWALNKRRPWFQLLFETIRAFLPPDLVGAPAHVQSVPWIQRAFSRRNRAALTGYPRRVRLLGPLPSFQENVATLDALRRQLACYPLQIDPPCERRYPYLDRDLLEFVYAVPREQFVRPGQRRSLMRRALVGIVPGDILNRKRKAFVARSPMTAIAQEWSTLTKINENLPSSLASLVDNEAFRKSLEQARQGHEVPIVPIIRTLALESWLRRLNDSKLASLYV